MKKIIFLLLILSNTVFAELSMKVGGQEGSVQVDISTGNQNLLIEVESLSGGRLSVEACDCPKE